MNFANYAIHLKTASVQVASCVLLHAGVSPDSARHCQLMEAELEQLASEPTARYSSRVGSYEQLRAAYAHVAEAVCQGNTIEHSVLL